MSDFKKANAFPELGIPGDPRLLDCLSRRTSNLAGGSVTHVFGSTILIPPKKSRRVAGGSTGYIPWKPTFITGGTSTAPTYKAVFNLGTVNDVVANNWNDEFALPSALNVFRFVVLTITTGSGKVTRVRISLDSAAPTDDTIAKNTPPVTFKIVLGAIGRNSAKMIVNTNISRVATEVWRASKDSPSEGEEIFDRYWRWA